MDRFQNLTLPWMFVTVVAGGIVAGAAGAGLHLAIESVIDWARGRRT